MTTINLPKVTTSLLIPKTAACVPHNLFNADLFVHIVSSVDEISDSLAGPALYAFHRKVLADNMVIAKEINNAESMLGKEKAKRIEMKFPAPKQAVRCLEMLYDKVTGIGVDDEELKMCFVEYYQDAIVLDFKELLAYLCRRFAEDWRHIYTNTTFSHSKITVVELETLLEACCLEQPIDRLRMILSWARDWPFIKDRRPVQKLIMAQVAVESEENADDSKGSPAMTPITNSSLSDISVEFPESFDAMIPVSLVVKLQKKELADYERSLKACLFCDVSLPPSAFDGKTKSCGKGTIVLNCGHKLPNTAKIAAKITGVSFQPHLCTTSGCNYHTISNCGYYGYPSISSFENGHHMASP